MAVIPLTDSFIELMRALVTFIGTVFVLAMGYLVIDGLKRGYRYTPYPILSLSFIRYAFEGYGRFIVKGILVLAAVIGMYLLLPKVSRPILRVALGVPVVIAYSGLLFWIKLNQLRTYAVVEGIFALTVCVLALRGMEDEITPAQLAGLLASAYLFVRAGDNFYKDLEKRREIKASMPEPRPKRDMFIPPVPKRPGPWWWRLMH